MRLAVVGADGDDSLAASFVRGALEQGHEAVPIFADHLVAGWRPLFLARRLGLEAPVAAPLLRSLERRLLELEPEPDVVLVVKGRFIPHGWLDRIRKRLSSVFLNYYPDHPLWPGHDDKQVMQALRRYDEVIVWADFVAEAIAASGATARVVPFGFDPGTYAPPIDPIDRRFDAVLIGQRYDVRAAFVSELADLRVFVSGVGWTHSENGASLAIATSTFSGGEICRLYWESASALNILHPSNVPAHNMRTFEIPATGTVMVATRTPEHEELFGDDGAVLVESPREARAAVLALLDDDDLRRRIGERGRQAVVGHTYAARMAEILAPWTPRS